MGFGDRKLRDSRSIDEMGFSVGPVDHSQSVLGRYIKNKIIL